ncbi:FtsK/SpoIIIE domain-containing protein [Streptomyces sp. NEAU-Y11]|uniref:FtsK/SpoIIIE domain-containing protein n=1 Tax=Streptomyces cucumeris TaxID=2962890 RepID=UPI0020C850AB|nr:FtsK/SpoIIIE domain-containing protein [Streptomyces sp. NEAU-Y11]MCP9209661.1 hypothetical protein [Streptomyces sp. NEAU-Y11]
MLVPTEEETRILEVLRSGWASKSVPAPWLREISVLRADVARSGVVADLMLSGVTMEKVSDGVDQLRLFFDVEDDHQLVVLPGGRATRVRLEIRTRRVTEEMDMLWHPGRKGIGVDSVTGQVVEIPFLSQIQFSGAKGSGKSWAMRPSMASLALNPDFEVLYLDPKMVEGKRWQGLVHTYFPGDFPDILEECAEDLSRRADLMSKAGATVWRPEFGPYRIVVIDEGRELLAECRRADRLRAQLLRKAGFASDGDLAPVDKGGALDNLIKISSMGRAWGVFLWWATQYPIVSGNNPGVDTNIDANTDYRFSLRVSKRKHSEVALGDDADYGPHRLTADDRNRGLGYIGGHGPSLIQTWTMTDEMLGLLAHPDQGRGKFPRDVALRTLGSQPDSVWTPELLASHTGCGTNQAMRFLRSFSSEGLVIADGDTFRLAA